jgi:F-type H+-transporting ATPase subunit c
MVRRIGLVLGAVATAVLASPLLAMAQEGAVAAAAQAAGQAVAGISVERGLIALAANLGIGVAAFGSALGQGRMAASAMESIGRNPNSAGQLFTPMIIGLAFIEALTLYALVIAFFLQAKI